MRPLVCAPPRSSFRSVSRPLPAALVLLGTLGGVRLEAQSVCAGPPYLGTAAPELCVHITETGIPAGASLDLRGPPPLTADTTVGAYGVDLLIDFLFTADGMEVSIEGLVTRTSPGTGGISVIADGGLGAPLPENSFGFLDLAGDATGSSRIQLGGAAGYQDATGDLAFTGFPRTCDEAVTGGAFLCDLPGQAVAPGAVAVHNITDFHITEVGQSVDIPSAVVLGDQPPPREDEPPPPEDQPEGGIGWRTGLLLALFVLLLIVGGFLWRRPRRVE